MKTKMILSLIMALTATASIANAGDDQTLTQSSFEKFNLDSVPSLPINVDSAKDTVENGHKIKHASLRKMYMGVKPDVKTVSCTISQEKVPGEKGDLIIISGYTMQPQKSSDSSKSQYLLNDRRHSKQLPVTFQCQSEQLVDNKPQRKPISSADMQEYIDTLRVNFLIDAIKFRQLGIKTMPNYGEMHIMTPPKSSTEFSHHIFEQTNPAPSLNNSDAHYEVFTQQ
jgi:hypothetical protein